MTKAVTEKELAEKAVAPRVTKSDIDSLKDRITYTTEQCPGGTTSTFVHAFLDGKFFLATGFSACVNAENFDADIGERLARSNAEKHAENKLWELEGYRLFTTPLQPKNHIERMQSEKHELDAKLTALCAYIGTKSVLATTMTHGEYNEYRGWQIPENEEPSEQGYLVAYVDGGKPNDDRHAGYISWSPRDVFEKSYHQSQTPQDRVRLEQRELYTRLDALENFLDKGQPSFINDEQWALLQEQQKHMDAYNDVLVKRITLF